MRLATRCPSCTTMFLVVEDQLRVSEGWVRCGRCTKVFNAVEDLMDVAQGTPVHLDLGQLQSGRRWPAATDARGTAARPDTGASAGNAPPSQARRSAHGHPDEPGPATEPATEPDQLSRPAGSPWRPSNDGPFDPLPAATPGAGPAADRVDHASTQAQTQALDDTLLDLPASQRPTWVLSEYHDELPEQLLRAPSRPFDDEPEAPPYGAHPAAPAVARFFPPDPEPAPAPPPAQPETEAARPTPPPVQRRDPVERDDRNDLNPPHDDTETAQDLAGNDTPGATPSFVRQAEQAARWRQSPMRGLMVGLVGSLLLLAAAQMALLWRDALAAHVPASAPALHLLCEMLGCQVQPLRRIEHWAVDSSGLSRVDEVPGPQGHRYRLSVLLHNRASTALLIPAIELTLTDARGETVSRRVLSVADFGGTAGAAPAGQELPLRLLLATGAQRIEGYTVELFYP